MTQFSPTAQTVLDAVCNNTQPDCDIQHLIAAALRAAADHAEKGISTASPSNEWGDGWMEGVRNTAAGLRAIAAQLEAANG